MQCMKTKWLWLPLACLLAANGHADDWPQFLGPTRNAVSAETNVAEPWPDSGPAVVWRKSVGHGFSGPVIAGTRTVLFDREQNLERVSCLDSATGRELWKFEYPTSYEDDFGFDDGPRATPAVSEERVYTFGAQGILHCLDLATGKKVWSADLQRDYQARKGFFGLACSPLIEGGAVLLGIGGTPDAGIVALDKSTGRLLWKSCSDEAGYSSPVAVTIHGKRKVLFLTRAGLVVIQPATGRIDSQFPFHSRNPMSVNAATPLVIGEEVFLSACYGTGAALLRVGEDRIEKIWSEDDLLSNHYATSVELNGYLYGVHGRTDPGFSPHPTFRCIDLKTRRLCWETGTIGAASVIRAGSQLLILTDKGELIEVRASPEAFKQFARARVLSGEARAFPAFANGFFYARSKDELVCLDLRQTK